MQDLAQLSKQGSISQPASRISQTLLADPVTELWAIGQPGGPEAGHTIEITFLPGVTDSVAENLVRAAEELRQVAARPPCQRVGDRLRRRGDTIGARRIAR